MLATQLHRSSDDLTRLVRTYAITGNKKYEQQFWNVLAIRDGVKPRPLHYNRVYWDFLAVENGDPPYPLGKSVPLKELMKEAGFTDREFSLLTEAQRNSDQLVELEQIAMNAMKGKTTGESGEIINDTSEQQVAIKILFGERYHQAKIKIMQPINMFLEELENRTHTEFTYQAFLLQVLLISLISTFILTICVVAFVMRQSKQYHASMISELNLRTVELREANEELSIEIDERKKMEEALLQSEKLKSIGTITAGISHEFNNLLAIISGNVQLLQSDYKDDKVLNDALCTIRKATDDGAEISSNMLKFTKTYHNTKELESTDIRDMIMQSIDFTKPRWKNEAQAKGIDYKIDTEGMKSVPYIMCKQAEIREIFVNLISNSIDAMPKGGRVSFQTWNDTDTVFVSTTDTGEGMTEDVQKNIFDPFFSTKGVEGTGLGMSIVYGIVTRHGGKIGVVSDIGNGTTFTIQFPTTIKKTWLKEVPEPKEDTNVKNLRILVIDDEKAIRNILNQFLSRSRHNVKTVDNGEDAIKMIEGEDFDLVLCDLAMPNVFGYDVVTFLNGLKKRPKIGIITGWSEERVSDKEMKVDFYLIKPFKHSELTKHINELFGADS